MLTVLRRRRLAPDPMVDEDGEPVLQRKIVHRAPEDMLMTLLGAGQFHAMRPAHEPAVHHGVRDFRVELQGIAGPVAEGLHRKGVVLALRQKASRCH